MIQIKHYNKKHLTEILFFILFKPLKHETSSMMPNDLRRTLKNNSQKITTPIFPVNVLPVKHCQNLKTKLF